MKIRIYVNHESHEVLNASDFENYVARKGAEVANCDDRFSEWLDENYGSSELFYMTQEKRAEVREEWEKEAYDNARDDLISPYYGDWKEYEVEI